MKLSHTRKSSSPRRLVSAILLSATVAFPALGQSRPDLTPTTPSAQQAPAPTAAAVQPTAPTAAPAPALSAPRTVPAVGHSADASRTAPPNTVARDAAKQFGEDAAASPAPLSFRPWAEGVNEEDQKVARALFIEGNTLLRDSLFFQAIKKYQAALQHWDHPAIHYNHALALSTLDQPIKTRDELIASMKYGAGPLGEDQFQQARRYKALVEKQLAYVTVNCNAPRASVTLNGKLLFTAPGSFEGFVVPGEYTIAASKAGYVTDDRIVTLIPGKPTTLTLGVYTEEELTRYKRQWPLWGPATVTAVGGATALGGAVLMWMAQKSYDDYDASVAERCPVGCDASSSRLAELDSLRADAKTYNTIALPMLIGGGAALVAGGVLLYVNRAKPFRVAPEDITTDTRISLSPLVGKSLFGLAGRATF